MKRIIPTLLLTTTLAAGAASPALAAKQTGVRKVCADRTYVRHTPKLTVIGTLYRNQRIKVTRFNRAGDRAYGFAYGHVRKRGWVKTTDLCH